ncbi:hypothetical protein GCM10007891_24650 [Methylophaga thalassica]|uniref:TraL protein n=1 Tax=Methylophaga thalassica TaxID=40223 RepID=A0ABQ5TYX1_9GAMM|nr:conjugal transfer protein TraL [Methylophaga thalassica]GLQ00612.1 hypothetical protein GCM10007891_24650 [Methylophaga thalassica]
MKKASFFLALALSAMFFIPSISHAASQDECAIWICLPGGFPSGCGAAKSAFEDRIDDEKSPLPPFSSCAVDYDSKMSYKQGVSVYEPAKSCTGWQAWVTNCTPQPARWVKDGTCSSMMCQRRNYIDVFVDGEAAGETFYY